MHSSVIAGLGALGAWLLVAGPLYQAAMELRNRGFTEGRTLPVQVVTGGHGSAWWWLVPPVAYWKHHRRRERIKRRALEVLPVAGLAWDQLGGAGMASPEWISMPSMRQPSAVRV